MSIRFNYSNMRAHAKLNLSIAKTLLQTAFKHGFVNPWIVPIMLTLLTHVELGPHLSHLVVNWYMDQG